LKYTSPQRNLGPEMERSCANIQLEGDKSKQKCSPEPWPWASQEAGKGLSKVAMFAARTMVWPQDFMNGLEAMGTEWERLGQQCRLQTEV
jgi:hypothetical protein